MTYIFNIKIKQKKMAKNQTRLQAGHLSLASSLLSSVSFFNVFCLPSIEHGTREKSNWQTNLTFIHLSVPLIDKEWDTQGKASETATFLFITADSNVTGINTALMHSPHALSFHWTPRLQSQPNQQSHSGALVATVTNH